MNETELLFSEILHCDRMNVYLKRNMPLQKDKASFVASVLKKRMRGEPIQYILGKTEFMGLEFTVNTDVFIPRPETEILVETIVRQVIGSSGQEVKEPLQILDIGTGSGCIAISLAKLLPCARITATDVSDKALGVALHNASLHKVDRRIRFIHSDLFSAYGVRCRQGRAYDIVVSNPPYVSKADIDTLQPEVRYEPRLALDGGEDGMDFHRRIIGGAGRYLRHGGFLILEIGFNQRQRIEDIFQASASFKVTSVLKDYNEIERVIVAKRI